MMDAGCGPQTIERICMLYRNGQVQDAAKALRRHRCSLMDSLHEIQRKIDCLDYLVRRMEKEDKVERKQTGREE